MWNTVFGISGQDNKWQSYETIENNGKRTVLCCLPVKMHSYIHQIFTSVTCIEQNAKRAIGDRPLTGYRVLLESVVLGGNSAWNEKLNLATLSAYESVSTVGTVFPGYDVSECIYVRSERCFGPRLTRTMYLSASSLSSVQESEKTVGLLYNRLGKINNNASPLLSEGAILHRWNEFVQRIETVAHL